MAADRARGGASAHALARLTSVSRALTYAVSIDEVLEITVDCAADLLGAPRVVLMLLEADELLRIRAARGIDPDVVERFHEPLDETLVKRLSRLLGPDARAGFLGVPLVVRGRVTGLLAVLRPQPQEAGERDEELLSALADQAAVALANARAERTRTDLATQVEALRAEGAEREDALRMVGHDLRSPLSALQGYVHLLETESYGPVTQAQRTALERLRAIGEHLGSLVSNVLEMGRLAAGTLDLNCEPVPLSQVVEGARVLVALAADDAAVELHLDVPPGLEVSADPNRLRQVLVQLLDNALKYSPEKSRVRLRAGEEVGADGTPEVVIRITDQGPGVPADQVESIFEPYHQLPAGRAAGGIGLGLAIARGLVERMGGSLAVEETATGEGDGATFLLRLPRSGQGQGQGQG